MIGLVLVTHGQLAEEFRNAVEHVVGPQDVFETVSIGADDDMEARVETLTGTDPVGHQPRSPVRPMQARAMTLE